MMYEYVRCNVRLYLYGFNPRLMDKAKAAKLEKLCKNIFFEYYKMCGLEACPGLFFNSIMTQLDKLFKAVFNIQVDCLRSENLKLLRRLVAQVNGEVFEMVGKCGKDGKTFAQQGTRTGNIFPVVLQGGMHIWAQNAFPFQGEHVMQYVGEPQLRVKPQTKSMDYVPAPDSRDAMLIRAVQWISRFVGLAAGVMAKVKPERRLLAFSKTTALLLTEVPASDLNMNVIEPTSEVWERAYDLRPESPFAALRSEVAAVQLAMHPVYFRYPDNRWTEAWMVEHYEFVRHGLLLPGEELPPRQLSTQEAIVKLEELSGLRPPARAPFIPRISKVFPAGAARNRTKRPAADRQAEAEAAEQRCPQAEEEQVGLQEDITQLTSGLQQTLRLQ